MPATGPNATASGDASAAVAQPTTPPAAQRPAPAAVSVATPPPRAVSRPGTDASANRPAAVRPAGGSSRADATRPAEPSTGAADATPPARLPAFGELPPDVKRGLPALVIGGSVYSADPSSRMLVINGQVVREGDPLGPDTVLEKIQPKQAIVRVRGQRATLSW
jgi:general secretion pathway protein B